MSRFFDDWDGDGVIPAGLWDHALSLALGSRRGQEALAELEAALVDLPQPRLVAGHLAVDGATCAVGALVARRRAEETGVDIAAAIDAMSTQAQCWCGHGREAHDDGGCSGRRWNDKPCGCSRFDADDTEDVWETVAAGERIGLRRTIAWHLAYLNDETFGSATPEERYERILAWVRRAQGKDTASVGGSA